MDPVPTRTERVAAVLGLAIAALASVAFLLELTAATVVLIASGLLVGTVTSARVTPRSLLVFGVGPIEEGDPAAERYRERHRRRDERLRKVVSYEYDPRWDRVLAAGLALLALGALGAVVAGVGEDLRTTGRLLVVGLLALVCSLGCLGAAAGRE